MSLNFGFCRRVGPMLDVYLILSSVNYDPRLTRAKYKFAFYELPKNDNRTYAEKIVLTGVFSF